jgi:hypothetical protein
LGAHNSQLGCLISEISRTLEPRAAAPARRLRTIRTLTEVGIPVSVSVAPIIPFVTEPEIEDYDSDWGKRMQGEGVWADLIRQRFTKTVERLGLGKLAAASSGSIPRSSGGRWWRRQRTAGRRGRKRAVGLVLTPPCPFLDPGWRALPLAELLPGGPGPNGHTWTCHRRGDHT